MCVAGGNMIDLLLIRMEPLDLDSGEVRRVAPDAFRKLADACMDCECKERCVLRGIGNTIVLTSRL